ncbi:DNA-directed RNA polymerase I subunit rpa49-like [Forsythia ovata]|uniref:DNA-directed RNA polymerase I subunit rpa49-like n=1 Tax=Forsythia ovata TaxID=205694 RepID=A0ABD1UWV9_9LAMI
MAAPKEKKKNLSLEEEKVKQEQILATKSRKKMKKIKQEQIDVKIQTVAEKKDKISSIFYYFPSSYDPLNNHSEAEPSVEVYRNGEKSNRLQMFRQCPMQRQISAPNWSSKQCCAKLFIWRK